MAPHISQFPGSKVAGLILVLAMIAVALPTSAGDVQDQVMLGESAPSDDAIHAILYDSSLSARERGLMAAQKVVEANAEALRGLLPAGGDWIVSQQYANLALAEQLFEVEGTHDDPFLQALEVAHVAGAWQASVLGFSDSPATPLAGYTSASQAVYSLLERHGVEATAEQRAEIDALDLQPAKFVASFARMVDAFMALETATNAAFDAADIEGLLALEHFHDLVEAQLISVAPGTTLQSFSPGEAMRQANFDVGRILHTRNQFIRAIQDLTITIDTVQLVDVKFTSGATSVPPVIAFDIRGFANSFYDENFALTFDIQGNDIYYNNAGGSNVLSTVCTHVTNPVPLGVGPVIQIGSNSRVGPGVAAAIDMSGNDVYGDPAAPRSCGANGGADMGVGALFDRSGVDTYVAGNRGVMGGAHFGVALTVDGSGDDTYTGTLMGINGGGEFVGVGLLVDRSEDDVYTGTHRGVNGGGSGGLGLLIDMAGHDQYYAGSQGTNGGGDRGAGFIFDNTGNDRYVAGNRGTNGGGHLVGVGIIIDGAENDFYAGGSRGSDGSGDYGVGLIIDLAGKDSYPDGPDQTLFPKGTIGGQFDVPHLPAI